MAGRSFTLVALAASALANVQFVSYASDNNVAFTPSAPLPAADFTVPLSKTPRSAAKKLLMNTLRKKRSGDTGFTETIAGADGDEEYLTNITIGGQQFTAIIDTGSSDTWLVGKGFKCFNLTSYPESQSECGFGSSGFSTSDSKTFKPYADRNFNISYGDGEFLTGTVGYDTVTVGGLSVNSQEIGVVTNAAWDGDGINSGLLGLAYSGLTSVYDGTNPDNDSNNNSAPYSPFFHTAISQGSVKEPYFSIALNRGTFANQLNSTYDTPLGYLSFGGIAPVGVTKLTTTVPVQGYSLSNGSSAYFFYNVNLGYSFPGSDTLNATKQTAILDSGTTLNYIPDKLAKAYAKAFVPPAVLNKDEDIYYVSCNATVPEFNVTIGTATFPIAAADQILPSGETDKHGNPTCISGTQPGGPDTDGNIFIMGDVFLHNVVATFNVVANQITLTQRTPY